MVFLLSGEFSSALLDIIPRNEYFKSPIESVNIHEAMNMVVENTDKKYVIFDTFKILPAKARPSIFKHFGSTSIRVLVLKSAYLTNDCMQALAAANLPIEELDLSFNKINEKGVVYLEKMVPTLKVLIIEGNSIKNQGFLLLAKAISAKMVTLNVACNLIRPAAFTEFFGTVLCKSKIKVLNISRNHVGYHAFKLLVNKLPHCTHLKQLDLSCIDVPSSLFNDEFMCAIQKKQIINLSLNHNAILDDNIREMVSSCNQWKHLRSFNLAGNAHNEDLLKDILKKWTIQSSLRYLQLFSARYIEYNDDQVVMLRNHQQYIQKMEILLAILSPGTIKRLGVRGMTSVIPSDLVRLLYDFF